MFAGQHASRLPVELWETVVDSCCEPQVFDIHLSYPHWCACALTCRAWLPRSRFNILYEVQLRSERGVDLLVRALADNPFFTDMIISLTISETSVSSMSAFSTL